MKEGLQAYRDSTATIGGGSIDSLQRPTEVGISGLTTEKPVEEPLVIASEVPTALRQTQAGEVFVRARATTYESFAPSTHDSRHDRDPLETDHTEFFYKPSGEVPLTDFQAKQARGSEGVYRAVRDLNRRQTPRR